MVCMCIEITSHNIKIYQTNNNNNINTFKTI